MAADIFSLTHSLLDCTFILPFSYRVRLNWKHICCLLDATTRTKWMKTSELWWRRVVTSLKFVAWQIISEICFTFFARVSLTRLSPLSAIGLIIFQRALMCWLLFCRSEIALNWWPTLLLAEFDLPSTSSSLSASGTIHIFSGLVHVFFGRVWISSDIIEISTWDRNLDNFFSQHLQLSIEIGLQRV